MKVVILAAGKGKRLLPLTETIPKTLLEINGKTILEISIDTLLECGIKNIFIVAGYCANKTKEVVDKYKNKDTNIQVIDNKEYETTDNMYSAMLGLEKCIGENVMIMNGDTIVKKEVLQKLLNSEFSNMLIEMNPDVEDGQKVFIKDNIIKMIDKVVPNAHGTAVNLVKLSKEDAKIYFEHMKSIIKRSDRKKYWWEQAINEILDKINIKSIEIKKDSWLEIDNHKDLEEASYILRNFKNG